MNYKTKKLFPIFKYDLYVFNMSLIKSTLCHLLNPNPLKCVCHNSYMLLLFLSNIIEVVRDYSLQLVLLTAHLLVV